MANDSNVAGFNEFEASVHDFHREVSSVLKRWEPMRDRLSAEGVAALDYVWRVLGAIEWFLSPRFKAALEVPHPQVIIDYLTIAVASMTPQAVAAVSVLSRELQHE
jgi:hypothetical protein